MSDWENAGSSPGGIRKILRSVWRWLKEQELPRCPLCANNDIRPKSPAEKIWSVDRSAGDNYDCHHKLQSRDGAKSLGDTARQIIDAASSSRRRSESRCADRPGRRKAAVENMSFALWVEC